jgi:predicted  nucleic acid-binding Zn-ribbon protein
MSNFGALVNAATLDTVSAKTAGMTGIKGDLIRAETTIHSLQLRIKQAEEALARATALNADWQSAMEAWKDLAVTLREEIKACPNQEAHTFGKDDAARKKHIQSKEDAERLKRGLKPKYAE